MINKPVHPGEIIRETCVTATGLTVTEAAKKLDVDRTTFSRLLNGQSGISPEMAIRLSIALKTSPTLWMNLQRDYDLWKARKLPRHLHITQFKAAA